MSLSETARITGAEWTDLDVGATNLTIQNRGKFSVNIVAAATPPDVDVYAVDAIRLLPDSDAIKIDVEDGDNVYARVYSSHGAAKSTVAWHETDPPA